MNHFSTAIKKLLLKEDLTADEMRLCVGEIMDGQWSEIEIASLLTTLRMKGEAATEIVERSAGDAGTRCKGQHSLHRPVRYLRNRRRSTAHL